MSGVRRMVSLRWSSCRRKREPSPHFRPRAAGGRQGAGAAFNAIVPSLVGDVLNLLIASVIGKPDFNGVILNIGSGHIKIGNDEQDVRMLQRLSHDAAVLRSGDGRRR